MKNNRTLAALATTTILVSGLVQNASAQATVNEVYRDNGFNVSYNTNRPSEVNIVGSMATVELTPNLATQAGAVLSNEPTTFRRDFEVNLEVSLGSDDSGSGGNGFAFVVQPASSPSMDEGSSLGYKTAENTSAPNTLAFELDTYRSFFVGSGLANQITPQLYTSDESGVQELLISDDWDTVGIAFPSNYDSLDTDGVDSWRDFRFFWDASEEEVTIQFDINNNGEFDTEDTIIEKMTINLIGSGGVLEDHSDSAHFGFLAATGDVTNQHRVRFDVDTMFDRPAASTNNYFSAPSPFSGPLATGLTDLGSNRFEVSGERLDGVTEVNLGDVSTRIISSTGTSITFELIEDLSEDSSIDLHHSGGVVRTDLIVSSRTTPAAESESIEPEFWTKQVSPSEIKLYAKNIVGAGKVQFFHNGNEVAWVNADDASDPKLRLISSGPMAGSNYLVRTRELVEGKNVFEIYLDGERVLRRAQGN